MTILQNLIFSKNEKLYGPGVLYFYGSYCDTWTNNLPSITIQRSNVVTTESFYNAFPLSKWVEYCDLQDLKFFLRGKGSVSFTVFLKQHNGVTIIMCSGILTLQDSEEVVHIPFDKKHSEGFIILKLTAIRPTVITGGGFATEQQPINHVRLGVVVTHFNQLQAIKRTIEHFHSYQHQLSHKVTLVIVDNSKNIPPTLATEGVIILPNLNYGGSGGYARGKLYLEEHHFTHCVFMDDDVDVDFECIYRTLMIFSYATSNFSISGTIISKDDGLTILQVGGYYKEGCCWAPVLGGLSLADVASLVYLNRSRAKIEFGAFPFYAYRLDCNNRYPFPFFVRGDDVLFGLQNNSCKKIPWLGIGISISCLDIINRESPQSMYQDSRALLILELSHVKRKSSLRTLLTVFSRLYLTQLFSYKYASVEAVCYALTDTLKGPQFYKENLDTATIRARNKALVALEKYEWYDGEEEFELPKRMRWSRIISRLTLNGFLLPPCFFKRKGVLQPKGFKATFSETYRYKKIAYQDCYGRIWLATHHKGTILKLILRWFALLVKVSLQYKSLSTKYREAISDMTSVNFWTSTYNCNSSEIMSR